MTGRGRQGQVWSPMLLQVVLKSNRWDQRIAPLPPMPLQAEVRT